VNKSDFEQLTDVRIAEAKALLDADKFDGAYYLAGYAVECALKACIAKLTNQYDFPPKENYYSHDIEKLVKFASLEDERKNDSNGDSELEASWQLAVGWSEQSRYERKTQADAQGLYEAITNQQHGVLQWVKRHW